MVGSEVVRVGHADGGAMVAVAPSDVVSIFYPAYAWVVAVNKAAHFRVGADKIYRFGFDLPVDAVGAFAAVNAHLAALVVTTEDTGKTLLERNDGAIKDTVGTRYQVTRNNRILRIAPHYLGASWEFILPGYVRQRRANNG